MKTLLKTLRTTAAVLAAVAAAIAVTTVQLPSASAAGTVKFTKLYADSPGSDRGSNKSLNAEYVVVHNGGHKSVKLAGYKIKDKSGHTYDFPSSFALKAGRSVTLHTGHGRNTAASLYWNQSWYIWNNTTDTAYLIKKTSRLDTCVFPSHHSRPYVIC
jgi:hypothetical protein